tara:strand:+ start:781 stop:1044 length:264 start_codon:yes stop_codon:yes gene_type:complete
MPAFTYYFSTIITIIIFAIIGAYVKQISLITELISDIGVVYVSYIQPSMFYLLAQRMHDKNRAELLLAHNKVKERKRNKALEISAYV